MNLGRAIRLCRQQKNLTLVDLAKATGLTPSYISKIERSETVKVPFSTVETLISALKIPAPVFAFLAADQDELSNLNPELKRELQSTVVKLIQETA